MSRLLFASLISVSFASLQASSAQTAPQPPTPPGPPRNMPQMCSIASPELVGVLERHNHVATDRKATPVMFDTDSQFTLLDSGAWSYTKFDTSGKLTRKAEGCLAPAKVDSVRALYTKATWKTTPVIHCMMATNSFTDYTFRGGVVWNARVCNGDKLDDDSAKAIATVTTLVTDLTKPSEIELSRGKPTK